MQLARIPSPEKPKLPDFGKPLTDGDVLSRGVFENTISGIVSYMEGVGIGEGAHILLCLFALAIYREFAPLPTA